ncbi:MAG: DUF1330 domain-containing protein [Erythrobacter sp.]|nr:DUF1330 domain-containing protein [Erythrobacter sp.]
MAIYIIARFKIHDRESYNKYDEAFFGVFEKFDGKLLSVDEEPVVLSGEFNFTRSVLLEFPSQAAAMAWASAPEYLAIAKYREDGSTGEAIMVKSFDGTLPEKSGS